MINLFKYIYMGSALQVVEVNLFPQHIPIEFIIIMLVLWTLVNGHDHVDIGQYRSITSWMQYGFKLDAGKLGFIPYIWLPPRNSKKHCEISHCLQLHRISLSLLNFPSHLKNSKHVIVIHSCHTFITPIAMLYAWKAQLQDILRM